MYFSLVLFFFDVILYYLAIMYIPQKKYYKINHFKNFLLNYEGSEDISNYNNIIKELDSKLKNCSRINQAVLAFSIILLIISIAIIFFIIFNIYISRESLEIEPDFFLAITFIINIIRFFFSIIDWSMAIAIIAKINKIREKEDKIGLTNEIKSGIIKVIIILSFYFIYCIFELCIIFLYIDDCSKSLFLYNKYYIEEELNILKNELEKNKINEAETRSKISVIPFEETERNIIVKNDQVKEENLLQLLKDKEKDIIKLKDQVNQKDKEINLLKNENKKQIIEIKELESENPYKLKKNEKLITIIFDSSDQKIHYSLICKNTQKFAFVEQELYENFPEYKETENIFLFNGAKINRNKTIEENNIKFSDHITFYKYDDFNGE